MLKGNVLWQRRVHLADWTGLGQRPEADTRGLRPAGREGVGAFISFLSPAPGRGRAGPGEACRRYRPPQAAPDLSTDVGERGGGDPEGYRRWGAREWQLRSPRRTADVGDDEAEAMVDPPMN